MKKIYFAALQILAFASIGQAQQQTPRFCGTSEKMEELRNSDPKIKASLDASRAELEAFTANYIKNVYDPTDKAAIFTIPVVFHIIHTGGIENISDNQILDAVNMMNLDYSKTNTDVGNTIPEFQGIVADCQIEFKLAKKDPNGNCTNGITRTFDNSTNTGDGNDQVSAVQADQGNWPGDKYLNIFVVANCGGAAGYSTYPSNWSASSMGNGIFILYNYVGSIEQGNSTVRHALSHEAGHWCNLAHCWGDSNNPGLAANCGDDDGVTDTPNTIGWTTCNVHGATCMPHAGGEPYDNVQNFMEYSYCSTMFTEGQKARMHAALSSSTGNRDNVVSAANLTATGVNDPEVFCKADFSSSAIEICVGGTVSFTDHSYYGPNTWSWNFTGGTPSTSSSQNPTITYNTPGTYAVSLTSGDGTSSDNETKTAYITVLPSQGNLPLQEGFESYSNLSSTSGKWYVDNEAGAPWQIKTGTGFTGTKCVMIANTGQQTGTKDAIVTGSYDLSNLASTDTVTLSFRTSFKQKAASNTDAFKVFASNDCGVSWSTRKSIGSASLSSGIQAGPWTPTSSSDWMTTHVTNILSMYFTSGFRLKFEFTYNGGNNIYLDDINLYKGGVNADPLSVKEFEGVVNSFNLYPNPASSDLNVMISIPQAMNFEVAVVDLSGKVLQNHAIQGQTGMNNVIIDVNTLAKGMYFVQINSTSGKLTKQFIRQ